MAVGGGLVDGQEPAVAGPEERQVESKPLGLLAAIGVGFELAKIERLLRAGGAPNSAEIIMRVRQNLVIEIGGEAAAGGPAAGSSLAQ